METRPVHAITSMTILWQITAQLSIMSTGTTMSLNIQLTVNTKILITTGKVAKKSVSSLGTPANVNE